MSSSLSLWLRVRRDGDGRPSEPRIFISYRRDDTRFFSSRVYDRLVAHFGKEKVFRDVDSIAPGRPWDEAINDAIGSCNVFVVLIGRGWLGATDEQGNLRLKSPDDRHRREIEAALERRIMVFPVLMEDMEMPRPDQLPGTLQELQKIQARRITDDAFDYGTEQLISAIEAGVRGGAPRRRRRAALLAGGLLVTAAIVAAVVALASGGGADRPSESTATAPANTTAAQPAAAAAEIETSKGVLRVTKVSQPDEYPPNCRAGDRACGKPRPGLRFLLVSFEPVGGFGRVPNAEIRKAYVQDSGGKRTETFEFNYDDRKSRATMAFAPAARATGFKLYWPGNDPVDLNAFLTAGGEAPGTGGGSPSRRGFSAVRVGQTKDEVIAIMGQPESSQKDLGGTRECWYYEVSQGSAGHTVCFDQSGRVVQRQ